MRQRLRRHLLHRQPGWQVLAAVVWVRRNSRRAAQTAMLHARPHAVIRQHLGDLDGVELAFPAVAKPEVSVVIPVYNKWALTRDCLASLVLHAPLDRIEVIVADDASSDETERELQRIANVVSVRNPSNLGFTLTANRGASVARGEHIVFLNNDTRVLPGWLEGLLGAMEDEHIGAAGSRLVYPTGRLQEAGGLVWSDASGWNIGRDRLPDHHEYNFRRNVDYCSGASLMVRAALFREVGGFDQRFAPAYYEDTDLCFSLRARGHRVVYEPASTLIHFEGGTHGTETRRAAPGAHSKDNQYRNQGVFAAKWSEELRHHLPPPPRVTRLAALRGSLRDGGPRVLVCDALVPTPDRDSGSHRLDWILRLLTTMSSHVTFVPVYTGQFGTYATALEEAGVEVVNDATLRFSRWASRRAGFYDLVILSRLDAASRIKAVRRHFPDATVLFDAADLQFLREERELALTGGNYAGDPRHSRRIELGMFQQCDITSAVTELEAGAIRKLVPTARVVVLPNVHGVLREAPPAFAERSGLLFIGSFKHSPNADAMHWFIDQVLPRVRNSIDVELVVVGDSPPLELRRGAGPRVRFAGYVEDVAPLFGSARVFVSPLRFGAGMKGKNGQAMSLGLPMVTTSIGAEGMDLVDGEHAVIRDDPDSFAAAVVQVHEDEAVWRRIADAARAAATERWSPDAMDRRLQALMQMVPSR